MASKLLMLLVAFILGRTAPVVAQDSTYVWQSFDGDPFNIQGTIVLDSSSSANGSAADVVSLTITDSADTFSWSPASPDGVQGLWLGTTFAWNQSQILQMDMDVLEGDKNPFATFVAQPNGTGGIFDSSTVQPPTPYPGDQSGEWVAASPVPEPSAFYLLFVGGSAALFAQWRKRQSC